LSGKELLLAAGLLTSMVFASADVMAQGGFDLVPLPGGPFAMGDPEGEPDEALGEVEVAPFRMMRHEVTNQQFAAFVTASGHITDPEREDFGYVWDGRWRRVRGADWRHPFGPDSSITDRPDHPVVQVSAQDAAAFCRLYDLRLPSEREWEFAARGADGRRFPWGDAPPEQPSPRANFGTVPCCAPDASDGHLRTAPVGSFPEGRSPFGLLDMAGNVWEWTSSRFPGRPDHVVLRGGGWGNNPYCLRTSYRHGNPPDIGLDMVGFRCASDLATR
jgi:formylglycine-generating enzyme required for sulfatase activity